MVMRMEQKFAMGHAFSGQDIFHNFPIKKLKMDYDLVKKVYEKLITLPKSEPIPVEQVELEVKDTTSIKIERLGENEWRLSGGYLDNLQRGIVFNDTQSLAYFQLRLQKDGIMDMFKEHGVQDGDIMHFLFNV